MAMNDIERRKLQRKIEASRDRIDDGGCAIALILSAGFIAHIGHAVLEAVKAVIA